MYKTQLFACLFFLTSSCFAQQSISKKYLHFLSSDSLKKQLSIIADDNMEGRETGTAGQRKAADYIESQFIGGGLSRPAGMYSHKQIFYVTQEKLTKSLLNIGDIQATNFKDFYFPLRYNKTDNIVSDKIIFVGYGIEDKKYNEYKDVDVKGNIVAFFDDVPGFLSLVPDEDNGQASYENYWDLNKKIEVAASKGAVGVLVINTGSDENIKRAASYNKTSGLFLSPTFKLTASLNYAVISQKLALKIFGPSFAPVIKKAKNAKPLNTSVCAIKKNLRLQVEIKTDSIPSSNVLGIVEGSDKKDEFVYVTAHYDHLGIQDGEIYNGADDDGSGTCAVIQMAKAFAKAKQEGNGPRRTMVFMTVSGEEKGLWGSEYYTDHPLYPLDKTSADLNIDMIGRIDTERNKADTLNYVYVVGHNKISSELPIVAESTNRQTTQLVLDYKFDAPNDPERIYYRSDHYNFARKGVPVLFFYDGMLLADYHQPTDDIDLINWPLYEKRTQFIYHTAWEIANRDNQLIRDKPLPNSRYR
ncbi:MAG: M28 family peptidase [Ferruginibacter sp.]|nr:M28 family peptidase [Ferruginibacter sp.]